MKLSDDHIEHYRDNGYLFPLDIFNAIQVDFIRAELEQARTDAVNQGLENDWPKLTRANTHYLLPFVYQVAMAPRLRGYSGTVYLFHVTVPVLKNVTK